MKILIKIAYDGSAFSGWQAQPGKNTVQQTINAAAKQLFGFDCDVTGCSRTDAGVNALGFYACIAGKGQPGLETGIPVSAVRPALNRFLPPEVALISACAVPDSFHPRYSAVSKTYSYLISESSLRNPFYENRVFVPSRDLSKEDTERMSSAAENLVGRHDFSSYMNSGSSVTDFVREIYSATVTRRDGICAVTLKGNGFLYNMVRILVGTLLDINEGVFPPDALGGIIAAKDRLQAGRTAMAHGLYLNRVFYGDVPAAGQTEGGTAP